MRHPRCYRVLGLTVALCLTTIARAEGEGRSFTVVTAVPSPPPAAILADWGGLKTSAAKIGVALTATYVFEAAYNPVGGDRMGTAQAGQLALGTTIDTGKLFGLMGGTFKFTMTEREGRSLSADRALGTLAEVQQIYGRGEVVRLTELSYDQKLFGGRLQVKLGRASEAVDFAVANCDQQNLSFCGAQPGINVAGDYWYNTPVAPLMARAKVNFGSHGYVEIGGYDANPRLITSQGALDLGFVRGSIGTVFPAEVAWTPKLRGTLPGKWVIGGWYFTGTGADVPSDARGLPLMLTGQPARRRRGRYGGYLVVQQQLTHPAGAPANEPDFGWSVSLNITQGDTPTSVVDNAVTLGTKLTGTFRGRPYDEFAIALARTHVNGRLVGGEQLEFDAGVVNTVVQGSEYVAEIYYGVEAIPGLSVRPNVQYIHHSDGSEHYREAVVIGLNVLANF